jgi:hypothetical protein
VACDSEPRQSIGHDVTINYLPTIGLIEIVANLLIVSLVVFCGALATESE